MKGDYFAMKKYVFSLLIFILLFSMVFSLPGRPAAAQEPPPVTYPEKETTSTGSYLLMLDMPDYDTVDIPAGMRQEQASREALNWETNQAKPLLRQLESLKSRGEINSYSYQPESLGISVQLPTAGGEVPADLQNLDSVQEMTTFDDKGAACGAAHLEQVQQQFITISQAKATPARVTATDPSIWAYAPTGSIWTYVYGETRPNINVTFSLLRNGSQVASDSTSSSPDGWYSFSPDWTGSCNTAAYSWQLKPGDVVRISAHGKTVSMTVVALSAWADPVANQVMGISKANQFIEADIVTPQFGLLCNNYGYYKTTTAAADGSFQLDFSGTVEFFNTAYFYVYALDANGNGTYTRGSPYSIVPWPIAGEVSGYLKPSTAVEVTLTRASVVIETANTTTDFDGSYYVYLSTEIQVGDLLEASGGGASAGYTVVPFSMTSNPTTNQVSGVTTPGRPVQLSIGKNYTYEMIPTTCGYGYDCKSLTAGGGGDFSATISFDLERADWVDAYIYDIEGNYQYSFYRVPAIAANTNWFEVYGYWGTGETELTIELMDAAFNVLETEYTSSYYWDNQFYAYFSTPIQPGYHVQVDDGITSESMTVLSVTGELNILTDHMTGNATAGKLLGMLEDYSPTNSSTSYSCSVKTHPGGNYDFNFTSAGVEAQDSAETFLTGSDGHYTTAYSHAFFVYVAYTYGYVEGYVPTPHASVTVEWLASNGNPIDSQTWSAYSDGYYGNYLDSYPFLAGQRIRVTSGAYHIDITLPNLTINKDVAQNRLYGRSVPSSMNWVEMRQMYNCNGSCWQSINILAYADGAGNYSASFNNQTYWDCNPVQVGNPCGQGRVIYARPDENELVYWTPYPSNVIADLYENDNSSASAVAYTAPSFHTFHTSGDVDWIKFTLTAEDIGKVYKLRTVGLGSTNDTEMELYDTDGTTLILWNDDEAPGVYSSRITWIPSSAGTYYVSITPHSTYNTVNCGAYYTFIITTHDFFLPGVLK
jgi:hypothetical protein